MASFRESLEEARSKSERLRKEIADFSAKHVVDTMTPGQTEHLDRLLAGLDKAQDAERAALQRAADSGEFERIPGDNPLKAPQFMQRAATADDHDVTGRESDTELRSIAQATIARGKAWEHSSDEVKGLASKVVAASDGGVAEHVAKFGNETYRSAWASYMANPDVFAATATDRERAALRKGFEESRATLELAGAVLPSPIDPSVHLSNAGVEGSLKADVRKVTTSANTWRGISSAGIDANFTAESTEAADSTPTLSGTTITCRKAQAMIVASLEAYADQPDFGSELVRLFSDGKQRLDEQKIWNGAAASNEPIGIWTAVDGGSYEVAPTTSESFGWEDVYKLTEALPARFRNNAKFYMELSTFHRLQKQQTPGSTSVPQALFEDGRLIGRPFALASVIRAYSSINPAATADNPILLFADLPAGYVWVDRVGMSIMPPQMLQNSSNMRLDGTVGVYAYWRSGGDILVDGSAAVLNVVTAA